MKTRQKIILGFSVSALLIPAVGALCLRLTQGVLEHTIGEDSVVLARETLDKIERSIEHRLEQAELYARLVSADPLLHESNRQFDRLAGRDAYVEQIDREWLAAGTTQPTASMRTLLDNDLAERLRVEMENRGFYQGRRGHSVFGEIAVTNRYGATVAQTRILSDYDQADEPWWQEAVTRGTYLGDVCFDESAGIWALTLAIRINDMQEELAGVIRLALNLEEIGHTLDEIRRTAPYATTHLALLTPDDTVIHCTAAQWDPNTLIEQIARRESGALGQEAAEKAWFVHERDVPGASRELVAHVHSAGHRGVSGLDWRLLVRHDADEVFAPVARLRQAVLLPLVAISVVVLILGLFVARSVSRPIHKLAEAALYISRGHLDCDLAIHSNDEVGYLATCFEEMTGQLKVMIERLRVEIEDRKLMECDLEIANQNLNHTVTQLRRTNQDIQDFTKAVAHDLKTPLRGMATLAEWLLIDYGDRLDDVGTDQIRLLLGRARRSVHLLDSILDYAHAGRGGERRRPVHIETLIEKIADQLELPSEMTVSVEGACPAVMTSEKALERVLTCLIDNAARHMDKSHGHIVVAAGLEGELVHFSVTDNGPGIDSKYHEKIFDLFQRLNVDDASDSAGVGLCIAKKIVERYAGRIWIESQLGQGAAFHFTWPSQVGCHPRVSPAPALSTD